jgi:glyoxylase-like metal-dependent hydrolase (beta-lactamase superfamily II)
LDRRTLLQGTLGGLVAATAGPLASAAGLDRSPGIVHLSEQMAVLSGLKDNVVAVSTAGGWLLIDSGSPGHTGALLAGLRRLGGRAKVHTLFNTHWHPDQTGSNAALGKAGARIIAQAKTRAWISTEHYYPAKDDYVKALPKAAWPTEVFYSTGTTTVGSERIDYGYLVEAHTDGDAYYHFRTGNVLAVGHVCSPVKDPQLDWFGGGWIGGRLDALTRLYELADEHTRIVPAYGPVVSRTAVKAEHDMLAVVYTRMVDLLRKGYSAEDMLKAGVMNGLTRKWTDPKRFVYSAFKGLWGHQDELAPNIV